MYYAVAQRKCKGFFSSSWEKCVVCFDTERRYLYVSKPTAPEFNLSNGVVEWKGKYKISSFSLPAKEEGSLPEQLLEVDFLSQKRPLEAPSFDLGKLDDSTLLCPSTSLKVPLSRYSPSDEFYLKDPFFLYELYEAVKDGFTRLLREMQTSRDASGEGTGEANLQPHTLPSPRPSKKKEEKESATYLFSIRFLDEYQYRRFVYVAQTVLSYDGLMKKPHMGYPPYDPRNLLSYGYIPLKQQLTFRELEKSVFYLFTSGFIMGPRNNASCAILERNVSLCITHDYVCVFRPNGELIYWINLWHLESFHYNEVCVRPYMGFLVDRNMPNVESPMDILFLPSPSPTSPADFDSVTEVRRVQHIMGELHSGVIEVRRVVQMQRAPQETAEAFATHFSRTHNGQTLLTATPSQKPPSVYETVLTAWKKRRQALQANQAEAGMVPAVPLHVEGDNAQSRLTQRQLREINERLQGDQNLTYEEALGR